MINKNKQIFSISPLIRLSLLSLYGSLTIPLPFLSDFSHSKIPSYILWIAVIVGLIILWSILSEKVVLDSQGISVVYPQYIPKEIRSGWSLNWEEIKNLKMRTTGQGGQVYYFVTHQEDRAYLLPMRVAGFSHLVQHVTQKTHIDTQDVRPLAQPWMYFALFGLSLMLWLVDIWVLYTSLGQNNHIE